MWTLGRGRASGSANVALLSLQPPKTIPWCYNRTSENYNEQLFILIVLEVEQPKTERSHLVKAFCVT